MAHEGTHNDLVAQEADRLEAAMTAVGLDPDSVLSYSYWDTFTKYGYKAAKEAVMQRRKQTTPRSAAEIIASSERTSAEIRALLARLDADDARRKAAEQRQSAEQTALAEIERRAARVAAAERTTIEQAYAAVLEADPALYDRYSTELADGVYATEPAPPPAPTMGPVETEIDQRAARLASERKITREQAYAAVLAARPDLYSAYVEETL